MAVSALAVATQGLVGLPASVTPLSIAVQGLLSYEAPAPPVPPTPPAPVPSIVPAGGGGSAWRGPEPDDDPQTDEADEIAAALVGALSPMKHADIAAAIVLAGRKARKR